MRWKRWALASALVMSVWVTPAVGHANGEDPPASDPAIEYSGTITNNETGEVVELSFDIISVPGDSGGTLIVEADFEAPSQDQGPGGIVPFVVVGQDWSNAAIMARVAMNYDTTRPDKLRINTVSGYWTPKQTGVTVWSRSVVAAQDPWATRQMEKYPSSNSFSYAPGWGWGQWGPQTSYTGSGATMKATYGVSGMASFTVVVNVKIPGP